ncbi:hypothetical protein L915_08264, partial [Phytophthora nicotianae]
VNPKDDAEQAPIKRVDGASSPNQIAEFTNHAADKDIKTPIAVNFLAIPKEDLESQ